MYKKNSLGDLVLLALEKTADGYVALEDFIYHPMLVGRDLKKSRLALSLKRLRERGLIEQSEDKDAGRIIYQLTKAGRDFILLDLPEDQIEWDGKWRLVIFDIPENKRAVRTILRGRLKLWGFKRWQQSVWASKKNVTAKLRQLVRDLKIENWVLVIESDNVGRS